jgi:hypothetical protein
MHTKIYLDNLKEGDYLEDLGLDKRSIFKSISNKLVRVWTYLTRDLWRALVNSAMNLRAPRQI